MHGPVVGWKEASEHQILLQNATHWQYATTFLRSGNASGHEYVDLGHTNSVHDSVKITIQYWECDKVPKTDVKPVDRRACKAEIQHNSRVHNDEMSCRLVGECLLIENSGRLGIRGHNSICLGWHPELCFDPIPLFGVKP